MESGEVSWPPRSARAALLSSPSGRKKFQDNPMIGGRQSPSKRGATTPSLLERLRAARAGNDYDPIETYQQSDEVEEDEETLQLQLAAIEAKLKLKKLQQSKLQSEGMSTPNSTSGQPRSAGGTNSRVGISRIADQENVQVRLSPIKRSKSITEPRSPNRVILGIDKGVKGADISLKRAKTVGGTSRLNRDILLDSRDRGLSRTPRVHQHSPAISGGKSFSERMAESRDKQESEEQRKRMASKIRSTHFKLDQTEIQSYRKAAEETHLQRRSNSPTKSRTEVSYSRADVIANDETKTGGRILKHSRTLPDLRDGSTQNISMPGQDKSKIESNIPDSALFEGFSQQHLSSRVLPHSFLKRTLPEEQFTMYKLPDLLKQVKSPDFELPEDVVDFVVFAIVASKSSPKDQKQTRVEEKSVGTGDWQRKWEDGSQNASKFMAFTLTDLTWSVNLYLFGTAVPRYHRLTPGTVVAILNPGIMPPKKGKEDTGAFSLLLNSGDDTVLEIGKAQHLGFCSALKKDGKECGDWVDSSKTEICEWHLNQTIAKTQSSRMVVNTGTNGFGGFGKGSNNTGSNDRGKFASRGGRDGLLPQQEGRRYDRDSQSHIYMTRSNPRIAARAGGPLNPTGVSAARMLDLDDPFLDGNLNRDKEALFRKRVATQQKERDIADQLSKWNSTSAGAEYMRERAKTDKSKRTEIKSTDSGSLRSALSAKANILSGRNHGNENGKRTADSVRLSPIKKTRFLTEKGIREAGRESLGVKHDTNADVDNDDDELDIV